MNEEQFEQAGRLNRKRFEIEDDIRAWESMSGAPQRLTYENPYSKTRHGFRSPLPEAAFEAIRVVAISALKAELMEVKKQFEAL